MQVRLLLAAIVVLGAVLRFVGLGHGLRHDPIADEAYFVDAARAVLASGHPDHVFHEYPALPVYLLLPAVALASDHGTAATYLAARSVIALSGVLSIVLAFLLGRRLAGNVGGLQAAAAIAVSTIDVRVAHEYRPDVLLGTAALVALLVFTGPGTGGWKDAARAGAAVGLATAMKFSGALLGPVWALALAWPRRSAFEAAGIGLVASLVAFTVLSPYSILDPTAMRDGTSTQAVYHFQHADPLGTLAPMALSYLKAWWRSFGPGGLLLAVAGAVLVLRADNARRHAPLVILPVVTVLVFSLSPIRHERFLLIASGAVAVLGAVAVARVARLSRLAGAAVVVAALAPPLATSVQITSGLSQPRIEDDTADWIHANLPAGCRVLTTLPTLALDAARFETRRVLPQELTPRAALEWDYVVLFAGAKPEWGRHLDPVVHLEPRSEFSGVPVAVLRAPDALRPRLRPMALDAAHVSVSAGSSEALVDGSVATAWSPGATQSGDEWIEVALPSPGWLGRVVLEQPEGAPGVPRNLRLLVAQSGGPFQPVKVDLGRLPSRAQQGPGARADVFLLDAPDTTALRILQVGRGPRPWQVAELRFEELEDVPAWAVIQGRRVRRAPGTGPRAQGKSGAHPKAGRPRAP